MRKRIASVLFSGAEFVLFDNFDRTLESSSLCNVLTAPVYSDRVLGVSALRVSDRRTFFMLTANNAKIRGDLRRRIFVTRIDPGCARPEQRTGFLHEPLEQWVVQERARLLEAAFTILRAWIAEGQPQPREAPALGSYEAWRHVVGGALEVSGVPGFLQVEQEDRDRIDGGAEAGWARFFRHWLANLGSQPIRARQLANAIIGHQDLEDALPEDELRTEPGQRGFNRDLGTALSRLEGRWLALPEGGTIRVLASGCTGASWCCASTRKTRRPEKPLVGLERSVLRFFC